jgi:hypothetical protein
MTTLIRVLRIDVTTRNGASLPQGSLVEVSHKNFQRLTIRSGPVSFTLPYSTAHKYLHNWNQLTEDDLYHPERLLNGTSITPTGETVEIDGTDKYGIPSIHKLLLRV